MKLKLFFSVLLLFVIGGCTNKTASTETTVNPIVSDKLNTLQSSVDQLTTSVESVQSSMDSYVYPVGNTCCGQKIYTYNSATNTTTIIPSSLDMMMTISGTIPDQVELIENGNSVIFVYNNQGQNVLASINVLSNTFVQRSLNQSLSDYTKYDDHSVIAIKFPVALPEIESSHAETMSTFMNTLKSISFSR